MPTTTGMKGDGFYDAHSQEQRAAIDAVLPWLEDATVDLPAPDDPDRAWTLLDIGSSEGANAIYAMKRLISALRRRPMRPIQALFDDLPTNDFNQLFANLFPDGDTTFADADIFSGAIGGSAFGRLVPSRTVHIATTFNAIGFLNQRPNANLPNYILPMGPGPRAPRTGVSVTDAEREPFRRQAVEDLHLFFQVRQQELVSGGKLLVQVFGRNQESSTSYGIYDVLNDALLDLVETDTVSRSSYETLVFPIYFRTLDELLAPISTDASLAQAFCVDVAECLEVPVPFNEALAAGSGLVNWADAYTGFLRAFTEAILAEALTGDPAGPDALDAIYNRVRARLIDDPDRYQFHYVSVGALLTRL